MPACHAAGAYAKTLSALASPKTPSACCARCSKASRRACTLVRRNVERRNALAAPRRRSGRPTAGCPRRWAPRGSDHRRRRLPRRSRHRRRQGPAGLRDRRRHGRAGGYQGAYGNLIVIDHGFGLEPLRPPVRRSPSSKGDKVKRGDIIGRVGATGRATGYHLHYEVLANGRLLNPAPAPHAAEAPRPVTLLHDPVAFPCRLP